MQHAQQIPVDPDPEFGILMAPVNGRGTWAALKQLRAALRDLRIGGSVDLVFVDALDAEGRAVTLNDPAVAAIVIGYEQRAPQPG